MVTVMLQFNVMHKLSEHHKYIGAKAKAASLPDGFIENPI